MPTPQRRLKLNKIRQVLTRHGTLVRYEQAEYCECGSIHDPGTPKYTCPYCHGLGVRYFNPIKMMIQMVNKNAKAFIQNWGVQPDGVIGITISDRFRDLNTGQLYQEFIPAPWDKITCLRDKFRHMQVLKKGEVHRVSGVTKEKTHYLEVIDGTVRLTQQGGVVYVEGTDFEIVDDINNHHRQISWISGGKSPAKDERYSISYLTYPTWILLPDYPRHRRESSKMIMTHVMAKQVSLVDQFQ